MSKQKARTIQSLAQAAKKSTGQGKDGLPIQTIAGHTTTPDGDLWTSLVSADLWCPPMQLDLHDIEKHSSNTHIAALKKAIAECGVSFSLYGEKWKKH